jgi:uncharacterized protein YbjT (DUF2867 family)
MKLTIIGATGKTGIRTVQEAVERGHTVTAIVRNATKLEGMLAEVGIADGVVIREADLMDRAAVEQALRGSEVVIYAAGPVKGTPAEMPLRAAQNVVAAMQNGNGKKLVWLTGAAVMDQRDGKAFSRKIIRGVMKLMAGKVLAASEQAYAVVTNSGLTYVVARPPMLADKAGGSGLTASYTPPKPIPLGREDLGAFLVSAAESEEFDNESPLLSYAERGA